MKKIMGFYLTAVMCLLPITVMGATLTAHWEMEETTGSTAYDSANSHDLTPQSGFTIADASTTGQIDNGFLFDGSGERLEHGTLLDTMPTSITIAGWIKPDATGMSANQCWFSKQNAGTVPGPAEQMWLGFNMSGSTPATIRVTGRSNGSYFTLDSGTTWADDTWYHVAFTWDSGGGEIFVDGQPENDNAVAIMGNGTALNMCIASGGSTSQAFKGVIDDVRVYDGVLSDSEVNDLYDYSVTYTLTVNNGTGDGDYAESAEVGITADTPASGYAFDAWTGDTAYVDNVNNSSTTVTMPAANVTVTATYEPLYTLTVNNGTGDGDYVESSVNAITADAPAAGYVFDAWTGDTAYVANVNSASTTVTMPAGAVTVTATYKLDLMAHWEMEETTGSTAYDETANSYDLSSTGGFTIADASTTGRIDNGFLFDGSGERLEHATLLDTLPDDGLTVAGWIKPDATGMSSTQVWFSKQNAGTVPGPAQQMWLNFVMSGSTPGKINTTGRSNGSFFTLDSGVTWVDDTWYHVAFTWDGDGGEIFVDGDSKNSNAVAIMGDGTAINMCIATGGSTSNPFKGVIDDVRVYDAVLTESDVNDLYDLAPSTYALTVNSGTGDGSYAPSAEVGITADSPASGYVFDQWTGDTAYVANVNSSSTTVTMPAANVTVTATYVANSAPVVDVGDDFYLDPPMNPTKTLKPTATDDGVPGTGLAYTWSKVSGPGTVTFSDDDALQTDITITTAGTYVVRLSVSDSNQIGTDDATIVVHNNGRLTYEIEILDTPMATADINDFTEVYTVDVSSYGIYTNGTNGEDTSDGINEMLDDIKTMNPEPNVIVFPTGTYLIDPNDPIVFDHTNLIVDMNDSTFKISLHALSESHMILIDRGTENFRLTNGTLQGDRYDHNYSSSGTHEHNRLLRIESGRNLEFDHLTIKESTGFAVSSTNNMADTTSTGQYYYITNASLESGGFDSSGDEVADANKIRTDALIDVSVKFGEENEFEFGQTYGYMGLYLITEREYQVYFYDANSTFIEKQDCIQYRKVSFPANTKYVNLEFNQSNIPTGTYCGRLTDMEPPEYVHWHDNWHYQNRTLGQAFCGGQKWIIENNLYEENGTEISGNEPTNPKYGIDFEDGWDMMQDIIFRNNTFEGDGGAIVVCAGSEMIFENNVGDGGAFDFNTRCENYVVRGNDSNDVQDISTRGSVSYGSKTGHLSIHDNSYVNGHMYLDNDQDDPSIMLEYDEFDNIRLVSLVSPGTEFIVKNSTIENTRWLIGSLCDTVTFEDCTFVGTDRGLHFYTDGADVTVTETNCTGTLTRFGDYTDREL